MAVGLLRRAKVSFLQSPRFHVEGLLRGLVGSSDGRLDLRSPRFIADSFRNEIARERSG